MRTFWAARSPAPPWASSSRARSPAPSLGGERFCPSRYVLAVPSSVLRITSSALGYFFFAGLQTFALLFVRGHYNVGQATAELVLLGLVIGALGGTLISGRLTDAMLRRGFLGARVWVPAVCYLTAGVLLVPGIVGSSLI